MARRVRFREVSLRWGRVYRIREGTEGRKRSEDCVVGGRKEGSEKSLALIKGWGLRR